MRYSKVLFESSIGNLTAVPHKLYAEKLYLIVATMTTTGYGDISINFIADALYVSVIIIIAKLLYSFIVGYYSSSMSSADIRQIDAQQDFDGIQVHLSDIQHDIAIFMFAHPFITDPLHWKTKLPYVYK